MLQTLADPPEAKKRLYDDDVDMDTVVAFLSRFGMYNATMSPEQLVAR